MSQDSEDLDWMLLSRYLTGDLSPAETEAVERWFEADPRHRVLLEELRSVWAATGGEVAGWDTERAVAELRRRVRPGTDRRSGGSRAASGMRRAAPSFTLARSRSWMALAAGVAVVVVGAGAVALDLLPPRSPMSVADPAPVTDIVTPRSQQAEVRLADGSRVTLAAGSRLSYAGDFGQRDRTVALDGEAYFDVLHDDSKPFRVRTAHGLAEDLGTAFVVRAHGQSPLQVVVTEGAVVMRADTGSAAASRDSLVLTRGQLGRVLPDGRMVFRRSVNVDTYLAWTRGELIFEDAPLVEVAEELSRWYDEDVRVANSVAGGRRFSGRFTRHGLEQAVRLVAAVADVTVQRTGAEWVFR